jgi:hypothetical protein
MNAVYTFWGAVLLVLATGWVMNIISLIHSNFDDGQGLFALRVVGIFVAPLGSVLGFFA